MIERMSNKMERLARLLAENDVRLVGDSDVDGVFLSVVDNLDTNVFLFVC